MIDITAVGLDSPAIMLGQDIYIVASVIRLIIGNVSSAGSVKASCEGTNKSNMRYVARAARGEFTSVPCQVVTSTFAYRLHSQELGGDEYE